MTHQEILEAIQGERKSQVNKWGDPELNNCERNMILSEEVGEVACAAHDLHFKEKYPDHCHGTETDLKYELIQVAAVCFAWLEKL